MRTSKKRDGVRLAYATSRQKMERVEELLAEKAYSRAELCDELRISRSTAGDYINTLKDAKRIYIAFWTKDPETGTRPVAHYKIGNEPDAKSPPPNERKRKTDKVQIDVCEQIENDLMRAKEQIRSIEQSRKAQGLPPVPPDPLLAWIPRRDLREAA